MRSRVTDIRNRKPLIVVTTRFDNPRLNNVTVDTSSGTPRVEGTFQIDITNTGFLRTRATRVTRARIAFTKGDTTLNIGEISEPVRIPNIEAGKTETLSIGFDKESEVVNQVVEDICDDGVVSSDISITISEIILAATYEDTPDLEVNGKDCNTVELDINGQEQLNIDQQYEWILTASDTSVLSDVQWDMGDGTTKSGTRVTHQYTAEGTYTIEATTESGLTASTNVQAQTVPLGIVGNTAPIVGDSYTWRATGTNVDDVGQLNWAMGDGSTYTGESVSHTYSESGTFNISLTSEVGESESLEVSPEYPDVDITIAGETDVAVGNDNTWRATGSNISDLDQIRWSMGDSTSINGEEVTHSYDEGEFEINVAGLISDTEVTTDTLTVNSNFSDITIDIGGGDNREVQSNDTESWTASGNNLSDATNIRWDMGDGTVYEGDDKTDITHEYTSSGEFQVSVEAFIQGNLISSDTQLVNVQTFVV